MSPAAVVAEPFNETRQGMLDAIASIEGFVGASDGADSVVHYLIGYLERPEPQISQALRHLVDTCRQRAEQAR